MDEVQYYKTTYSKFWKNQTRKYGYGVYEQKLTDLILRSRPQRVFEVGIGTGWPIGSALKQAGVVIDGCDIAESSIAIAQKELDNAAGIWAGDVMAYKGPSEVYDVTYCVRASWYIPNFYQVIEKMVSMTKQDGYIIFDVMDRNSICYLKSRWKNMKEKYYKVLGIHVEDHYGTHFLSIHAMKRFLHKIGLSYRYIGEREITGSQDIINTPKVVFCCTRR